MGIFLAFILNVHPKSTVSCQSIVFTWWEIWESLKGKTGEMVCIGADGYYGWRNGIGFTETK